MLMRPNIFVRETLEESLKRIAPELLSLRQKALERKATDIRVQQPHILGTEKYNATSNSLEPLANNEPPLAKNEPPLANRRRLAAEAADAAARAKAEAVRARAEALREKAEAAAAAAAAVREKAEAAVREKAEAVRAKAEAVRAKAEEAARAKAEAEAAARAKAKAEEAARAKAEAEEAARAKAEAAARAKAEAEEAAARAEAEAEAAAARAKIEAEEAAARAKIEAEEAAARAKIEAEEADELNKKLQYVSSLLPAAGDGGDKTIIHVLDYSSGFGDFLRGSILLAEYAKHLNIQIKLNTSRHILSKYLEKEIEEIPSTENVNIIQITKNLENRLLPLFENFIKSNNDNIYITTNYFYNKNLVTQEIKDFINFSLKFKQEYYDKAKMLFNLKKYTVLHIRCEDDKFETDINDDNLLCQIIKLQLNNDTLVISNNYPLKKKLNTLFGFHYINNIAIHSAKVNDYSDLETTILDYIILSKSHRTHCFSYYKHGSGFSEQCSILNNIPYSVVRLSSTDKPSIEDTKLLSVHYANLKNNTIIPYGFDDLEASYESREHTNISFITLTNNGYVDYTLNCLKSIELAGIKTKLKVYCIGEESATILNNKGITTELIDDETSVEFQEFRKNNWSNIVFYKFKIIYDNLLNNEYVCITDGDIVYENNCIFDYLLNNIKDNDMLIQSDGNFTETVCSGFIFIKSNQDTISLFNPSNVEEYRNTVGWGDQIYINSIKNKLKYKKLPLALFPSGKYYYQYSEEIKPYLIHFNWVVGHEKKNKMVKYNKWLIS
jgi:hypothetical protein